MDIKAIRLTNLGVLLARYDDHKGHLAAAIRKKPAQVSQWFAGVRTISEESARDIEKALKLGERWMDRPSADAPRNHMAPGAPPAPPLAANEAPAWPLFERIDEHKLRALARADLLRLEGAILGAAALLGIDLAAPPRGKRRSNER